MACCSRSFNQPSPRNPQPSTTASPCYDGNGNVSAYINVASGAVISKHDYDPFGRPVWTELEGGSTTANSSPLRFSTKYEDVETGLVYYGFRYYSAELGRWLGGGLHCRKWRGKYLCLSR